jgi:hypothetical protein
MPDFLALARAIEAESGMYSGGPDSYFGAVGRDTLINLLTVGLAPDSNLLDFGCGALRLGYWLVRFLDADRYHGIEPTGAMLNAGKKLAIGPDLIEAKRPKFDTNYRCDMSVFGISFDFVVARSILTHTTPSMMRHILFSFSENSAPGGVMLASYWNAEAGIEGPVMDNIPISDPWDFVEVTKYTLPRIVKMASAFRLSVRELEITEKINEQTWLEFRRGS